MKEENVYSHSKSILQEMFGEYIEELKNPNLLKPFDEVFELQLPLRNAKLKFHSKVRNHKLSN